MKNATVLLAAVVALTLPACGSEEDQSSAPPTSWTPIAGLPFEEPEQIYPNSAGVTEVHLTASTKTIEVSGADLGARPYGDSLNGPTLHVRAGGTLKVTLTNDLGAGQVTNIHYHGLHVSPLGTSDNIFRKFDDKKTYQSEIQVPANHSRGTFWYHAHYHTESDEQVMGGLSGLLIIEGLEDLLPEGERIRHRQIALRDVQTTGGSINREENINPNQPTTRLVNALYQPNISMRSNESELWRLANIGSDVFYNLQLTGHEFTVVSEDGLPVWRVTNQTELLLAPGKRFDVLLTAGSPGVYQLLSLPYAQHATQPVPTDPENLATLTVGPGDGAPPPVAPPSSLVPEEDLSKAEVAIKRPPFVFGYSSSGPFEAQINGVAFTEGMMPPVSPILNTIEEWTLQNSTADDHPFHIHVNDFQVLSVNGQPYQANGHQDVVIIPKQYTDATGELRNGEVVIRSKFTDFTGWFVYHCHILQHEDLGMMATIQVRESESDPITPPPPEGTSNGSMPGHGGS